MQSDPVQHLASPRRPAPMRRLWTVVLAVLSALAALCLVQLACRSGATTARGNGVPAARKADRRVIEVDGTARLNIAPDRVDLFITLSQDGKTPRAAAQAVHRQRKGLLTAMRMLSLPDKRIVISNLNLNPRYARYGGAIEGYTGNLTFVVKLHDPGQLTDYVEAAAVAGAARLRTRFRSSRMQEMKRRVREMALKAARAKAEQIAAATGVDVGQLRAVRESTHGNWMGSRWGWGGVDNRVANSVSSHHAFGGGPARPDAIRLHLSVVVSYAIR